MTTFDGESKNDRRLWHSYINNGVNRLTNACEASERVVFWTFLDVTSLGSTSVKASHLGLFKKKPL